MKKITFTILSALLLFSSTAQIVSNLVLMAKPPAQLSEWGSRREVLTLILTGQGVPVTQFKIKAEVKTTDGTVVGSVDLARTAVLTGNPAGGATILSAADVLPLEYMNFTGKYKSALQRTGKLPADNYILCTRPVRPADYAPLGEEQCKPFYLASLQLPVLMKPYNEELLDAKKAQTAIIFRWSPVVPAQTSPVTYRIQVFEVMQNQSPVQALRSNQPLLDKELLAVTQYVWQPQLSFSPEENKKSTFIWTIQSLDKDHKPVTQTDGNGEGRSEPIVFFVENNRKD